MFFVFKPVCACRCVYARRQVNLRLYLFSVLFQDYHIPACHSKYLFLLHCGDDYGAEALCGHGGLDDVGVLPAGFVENPEVVVDHECPFAGFFCRWFALKIPPVRIGLMGDAGAFVALFRLHSPFLSNEEHLLGLF